MNNDTEWITGHQWPIGAERYIDLRGEMAEDFMDVRPMNVPPQERGVFDDEREG